jgi:hypothetical protein
MSNPGLFGLNVKLNPQKTRSIDARIRRHFPEVVGIANIRNYQLILL